MDRMPHFTTLHKFSGRLDDDLIDRLLGSYAEQLDEMMRRSKEKGAEIGIIAVRRHLKQTIGVDVGAHLILAMRERIGPTNGRTGHDSVAAEGTWHRSDPGDAGRKGIQFGRNPSVHLVHNARGSAHTVEDAQERLGQSH